MFGELAPSQVAELVEATRQGWGKKGWRKRLLGHVEARMWIVVRGESRHDVDGLSGWPGAVWQKGAMRLRALDLFCRAGGVSVGLERAGFEVVGVDLLDMSKRHRGGTFVQGDALTYPLDGFDFVWASPPCQAHTVLRALHPGKEYPDLIPAVRERLGGCGVPWVIENVPGAPLEGGLLVLCGTMFGLVTPDGSAETP